jgi:hypothetical protein
MIKREFLVRSGILGTGAACTGDALLSACSGIYTELSKHVIDGVSFGYIDCSWPRIVGKNALVGRHGQHH